ncbi:hypothetical protein [Streptomyces xanthochromogenes]|uniref:Uncharacterized protein n=1 Tax=Streptomyces xanthochromogenes TaxID=67384 RepID=A0ABQ3ASV0_9ACTN|nr:hypothetical protein [Streptomyces xanthochromogenes]GGY65715.1 hypothetical protein GCM10010326_70400 [Streptomyces xanthochromogenes]
MRLRTILAATALTAATVIGGAGAAMADGPDDFGTSQPPQMSNPMCPGVDADRGSAFDDPCDET